MRPCRPLPETELPEVTSDAEVVPGGECEWRNQSDLPQPYRAGAVKRDLRLSITRKNSL